MRWEGADPITSAAFYRAVVQTVLLFGFEKWFLSAATEKRIVGFHTFFLQQVTGKRARRRWGGTWRQGRYRERSEGGGESGRMDIHRQAPNNGGTVGGPLDHIRILHARDKVIGRGGETGPMVAFDVFGYPTEVYAK